MSFFTHIVELSWRQSGENLRELGERIHENIRESVLTKVASGKPASFVSHGVASPPGPVRLILEDRRNGLPGKKFSAILRRQEQNVVLSIKESRLRRIPTSFLDEISAAVRTSSDVSGEFGWQTV